ncbi:DUF1553 domain-containing protein [Planctomycetales bacterium ZRK34]|nr:DUF1553 domain-containing protein [Planctomycetales bacterium ZRK34]
MKRTTSIVCACILLAIAAASRAVDTSKLIGVDLWSVKPVQHVEPPADGEAAKWSSNPIDRFVRAAQQQRGLTPVKPADRRTLIRRAYFDLIGLPPTPEQVAAFVNDKRDNAWSKVIDELLASPAYGERWGRHWLDVVRYADTAGDNSDYPVPQLYKYRNYVIDAFNDDKPYDQFIREQIAGDLMPHADDAERREHIIATGYIALSRRFGSQVKNYPQYLTIEDTIDNLGKSVLGLSINCARCHDHKYDPISNDDYYALYGFFASTQYAFPGIELLRAQKDFVPLIPQEQADAKLAPFREKIAAEQKKLDDLLGQRSKAQKELTAAKNARSKVKDDADKQDVDKQVTELTQRVDALRKQYKKQERVISSARQNKPHIEDAYGICEGKPMDVHIQVKGNPKDKGPLAKRHFLTILGGQTLPTEVKDSGRLQLAQWLTAKSNPLTARVMANRIWQHHFGVGIVATPNDFGNRGKPPTHPKLLDYLAKRFMSDGWSIKKMHRLVMTSKTYQLASDNDPANARIDPTNDYLWRARVRRLDAEAIRDTMLAISGKLDRQPLNEPHPFPSPDKWNFTQHRPFKAVYESNKRSVYLMTQRIQKHPYLALFDGADTNASTGQRDASTTTLQALYMLNDPFVHEQADALAARLIDGAKQDTQRVRQAFEMVYSREPSEGEVKMTLDYLNQIQARYKAVGSDQAEPRRAAWASLCRAMLRSNEFLFVE